jgi:cellulose biosynthesis protein BcsQ
MKTIVFFNNKGGVGKTSLVYHLAWMFALQGTSVLAIDLDPQANLTSMFLEEEKLESLWQDEENPKTIYGAIQLLHRGLGDIRPPHVEKISERLGLIAGDLALSHVEDRLSEAWPRCQNRDEASFRAMTAFHRVMQEGASWGAEIVLMDVGPNLGALNRAALISSSWVVLPLGADLFSIQGLKNLGPTLKTWKEVWAEIKPKAPKGLSLPEGSMTPLGYIVSQHGVRESRPVKSYQRWAERIPSAYRQYILEESEEKQIDAQKDPHALALLKHYRSLMPLAMESRKPMFLLKSADGAIGAHQEAVLDCHKDFLALARRIASGIGLALP